MPAWDRQGPERLVHYCALPPFSQERLGYLDKETFIYRLSKPLPDGRTDFEFNHGEAFSMESHSGVFRKESRTRSC